MRDAPAELSVSGWLHTKARLPAQRYIVAVFSVTTMLAVLSLFYPYLKASPFAVFYAAVMISAWHGGLGPGLLSVVYSSLVVDYFFMPPNYSLAVRDESDIMRLGLFIVVGTQISILSELLHREKRRAEESWRALRASEETHRLIVETTEQGIWMVDARNQTTFVNSRMAEMLGYRVDEMHGKNPLQFLAEESKAHALEGFERRRQGIRETREYKFQRRDGSSLWTMATVNPVLDERGRYAGALSMVTDITERKQAEEALFREKLLSETTIDSLPGVFYLYDDQGRFLRWNRNFERVTGYSSEEIARMRPRDFFADAEKPMLAKRIAEVFAEGESSAEGLFISKDGSATPYFFTGKRILLGHTPCLIGVGIDITERKRAAAHAEAARAQLSQVFERVTDAFVALDSHWRYTYVNAKAGEIFGRRPEDLIGKHIWAEFPEGMGQPFQRAYERAMAEQQLVRFEDYYPPYDRWFENIVYPSPEGLSIYFHDITERKQVEEAHRESENKFRMLAESSASAILLHRDDGRFVYVNPAAERMTGYTREELLRLTLWDLLHPTFREAVTERLRARQAGAHLSDPNEAPMVIKSGATRWISYTAGRVSFDGAPAIIAMATDVTERKQAEAALRRSEQMLRLFVEHSPAAIAMFDRDMKYIAASRRYYSDCEFGEEELIGRSHYEVFPEMPERWKAIHRRCLAGAVEKSDEDSLRRANGSLDWVRWEMHPWHEAAGEIGGIILFSEVITGRKRAEELIKESNEQLRALSARLQVAREEEGTRIAREIHDELGGALTGLKWDLERIDRTLSESGDGSAQMPVREKIGVMTRAIDETINAVRRISSELRPGVLDDLGLVAAIEWQAEQFQERTGIACECEPHTEDAPLSKERSSAVFRILQEILTNVLRHAQATSVKIKMIEDGGQFVLEVEDDGKGITVAEESGPRSLGLLGMRERAHLVGGEVEVGGRPGRGTKVTVRVPFSGVDERDALLME